MIQIIVSVLKRNIDKNHRLNEINLDSEIIKNLDIQEKFINNIISIVFTNVFPGNNIENIHKLRNALNNFIYFGDENDPRKIFDRLFGLSDRIFGIVRYDPEYYEFDIAFFKNKQAIEISFESAIIFIDTTRST